MREAGGQGYPSVDMIGLDVGAVLRRRRPDATYTRPDRRFRQLLVKLSNIHKRDLGSPSSFCSSESLGRATVDIWKRTDVFLLRHEPHREHSGVEAYDTIENGVVRDPVQEAKEVGGLPWGRWWVCRVRYGLFRRCKERLWAGRRFGCGELEKVSAAPALG